MSISAASLATALVAGCGGNGGGDGEPTAGTGGGETSGAGGGTVAPGTAETGTAGGAGTASGSGTANANAADPVSTFTLGAERSGWRGRQPEAIAGRTNPILTLQPGITYGMTWRNLDGREHRLVVENGSGERIAATESASEQGATRSVTFEATADVASYYCEFHPESMRGELSVFGSETGTAAAETETRTGTETETPTDS